LKEIDMDRTASIYAAALAAMVVFTAPNIATADSLEVSPTTVTLDTRHAGVINVVNRGDKPIIAQVEAFDWQQKDSKDQFDPSKTLQVSPPMVHLKPGEKQIVRLRATSKDTPKDEQAFRLVVSELPSPSNKIVDGVRMLLQFKLPVFVGGKEHMPRQLTWHATPAGNDLILQVSNGGSKHVKLAKLHVVAATGQDLTVEPESFYYVLPGATREWKISEAGITAGATLHIEGVDEANGTKIDDIAVAGR
jgi:fimbrial chaperone protein